MERITRRLRQFHNKNRGFTLVEMIVSFLLVGLFMVAASKVIINAANVYYEAKGTANGMQVCSILTAKLRGEVGGAAEEQITIGNDAALTEYNSDGTGIRLTDAKGCKVYIGVKDGYLNIYYYDKTKEDGIHEQWTFGESTYMGYTIKSLTFSIPPESEGYNKNVVCMTLTVTSPRYGDYTATEYIECYNLEEHTKLIKAE